MALVTRPQRGHSPRHHQERPDPLEYLTPEDRLLNKGSSPFKASYYIPIVICIVHLDISLLSACQQANAYKENSNFSPNELSFIESRIPSVEVSEFFKSHSSFRSDIELKEAIEAYVDGLSKEKLLERLRSQGTIPFWTKMVIQYVNFGILTLDRTKIARADGNEVEVHENEFRRAVQELEAVYKCSLEFRDAIRVAAAKSEVDETSLGILKKRMDALNENFILMKRTLSGKLVGKPDETLMYPGDKWWYVGSFFSLPHSRISLKFRTGNLQNLAQNSKTRTQRTSWMHSPLLGSKPLSPFWCQLFLSSPAFQPP